MRKTNSDPFSFPASFESFLPRHAVVMTRRGSSVSDAPEVSEEHASELGAVESVGAPAATFAAPATAAAVLGEGNSKASLMFVGESDGPEEDIQGRPFAGKSGQLLGKMIEAMGLRREDVYIVSIEKDEAASCSQGLSAQIQSVQPKVVVALGEFAAQVLLQTSQSIQELRGTLKRYSSLAVMPTFHPSHLLKAPEAKRDAWTDLLVVARELGIVIPKRGGS